QVPGRCADESLSFLNAVRTTPGGSPVCWQPPTTPRIPNANTRDLRQSIVFSSTGRSARTAEHSWPRLPFVFSSPLVEFTDETGRGLSNEFAPQLDRYPFESANRLHRLQQIPTIAGASGAAAQVVTVVEVVDCLRTGVHAQFFHLGGKDALVDL